MSKIFNKVIVSTVLILFFHSYAYADSYPPDFSDLAAKLSPSVVSISITFILLFICNSAVSFDFAPEVGDYAPNFQFEGFNKNI